MASSTSSQSLKGWMSYISTLWLLSSSAWISGTLAQKSSSDYYVSSLPGAPQPLLKMHAGHIEVVPGHHGNMFFWHFQNRHIGDRQRTVLWLNGGPGCSSEDGALMEVGPYRVKKDGKLEYNKGSWDEFANLLFVDNPVGTGFSYVDSDSYLHELPEMAANMVVFLEEFFRIFPEYSKDDLYIAGESYAGQHIPYIAQAILDRNEKAKQKWNLSGLLIGNGWISGPEQYLSYLQYGYKQGLVQAESAEAKKLESQQATCVTELNNGGKDHVNTYSCEKILEDMLDVSKKNPRFGGECMNMYDIRLHDTQCGMLWPPDLENVTPYLRRSDVLRALNINEDKKGGWTECNGPVGRAFSAKTSPPSRDLLPNLLEKIPITLFSGDQDLICNHLGTEDLINRLQWNGATGMEVSPGQWAPKRDWTFEGEPAGLYQEARNLTYILFYNSSHMVPYDYPRRSRDMLDRFMGVDIASIGGEPADSRIDGEKGTQTSVGGHPNSTAAEQAEKDRVQKATWKAYYKSGEVALVVVLIAAGVWGWFLWRSRRKMAGYRGVFGGEPGDESGGLGLGLNSFGKGRGSGRRDVEAADFDEAELDDLGAEGRYRDPQDAERERFDLGEDSEEDEEPMGNGKAGAAK